MFILTDIEGLQLSSEEKDIIKEPSIFGILLFTRNYETPEQLRELTKNIHQLNPHVVIAVDQEGGRVQRFRDGFTDLKPMSYWGSVYDHNPLEAVKGLQHQTRIMVTELQQCGVQVSLAPVLDIDYGKSAVIGERSFHRVPMVVTQLAKCVIDTMHEHKMPVIGKHFPGHGGVTLDSHHELPIDPRSRNELWNNDIEPYRSLLNDLDSIMPAHIVYPEIDSKPVAFSKHWIVDILRTELNYEGLIITDDLSMGGAVGIGSYLDRAHFALEAGCDILTLCNNRDALIQLLDHYRKHANIATHDRIKRYIRIFR